VSGAGAYPAPVRVRPFAALASLAVLVPVAGAAAASRPGPPTDARAWTAEILHPLVARKAPGAGAGAATRLKGETTFTRGEQVLLVLDARRDRRGTTWVKVDLPKRPNGSTGWVSEDDVQLATTAVRLRVSLTEKTLTVLRGGRPTATYKAAVGKPATPTTTGLFAVADRVPSNGHLGPYILVLTAYSDVLKNFLGGDGVAGIHGWGDTSVLGTAASNGCVRLSRDAVRRVARVARAGTPVQIVP
jgi:lipoprotein-anchoring transpeptidase ErfK/SrfK